MMKKAVSHYEIVKELGRGGMATVYEAIDLTTNKRAALKVLLPHLSSEEVVRKRFLREARAGMELNHPGMVKVYEVGEEEGQPFIAMELVEGRTLDEVMREGTLDVNRVIDIGLKVADVLAAAHGKRIIHRDIKPRNIMVNNGDVKVMDFGLARVSDASSLTEKYEILGTLHYMSPEQAIGVRVDERTDIFSLGVVIYQLLTGILPFEGEHPGAIIHSILHSDPLRMEELREGIPIQAEQVVFKALQKKAQDRYDSAKEFKSDLQRVSEILEGKPGTLIATEEVFEERARGIYSALVGREREMQILEGHLERMLRGEGSTVLVAGEAGIGKSRLVWELGRKAKRDRARYLRGNCLFGGEGSPYQPVFEVIRSYLELKGVRDAHSLSDFLRTKAPHLADRTGVVEALLLMKREKEPSVINREQLWDVAARLVRVMSEDKPTLLHLDDLQWADAPTLNLLVYISRNTGGDRILIVGTYRPEELTREPQPHPLLSALERMRNEGLHEEVSLGRLDETGTRSVIESVFSGSAFPETFAHSVHAETEGNPLFILEVLQMLANEGAVERENGGWRLTHSIDRVAVPDRVSDVIANRLRSLNREERTLIQFASVEGRSFQSDTLAQCLGLPRMKVLLALQDLEHSHRLIHASEREYHFDHGKIRQVVYDGLIAELRKEYHGLIGDYLIQRFRDQEEYAGRVVHHLLEAEREGDALPYLLKAGEHARKLFANEEAIGYFDRGIELMDRELREHPTAHLQRDKLVMLKGRAEVKGLTGRYDEARHDYDDVRGLAEALGDQREHAHALMQIGEVARTKGDCETALTLSEEALGIEREIGDREGESNTLASIGAVHRVRADYEQALLYLDQSLMIRREIGDRRGEGSTLGNIGIIHTERCDYDEALSCFEQSLAIARELGDRRTETNSLSHIGVVHMGRGDYDKALMNFEQSLAIKREIGDRRGEGVVLLNMGIVHRGRGDWEPSFDYMERALMIQREIGDKQGEGWTLNDIGIAHYVRSDHDRALEYFEQALMVKKEMGDKGGESATLGMMANIYDACADYERALGYYEQALKIQQEISTKEGEWQSEHNISGLWLHVGDERKALEGLERAVRVAETIGTKKMKGWLHLDASVANSLRGSYEDADVHIKKSLEIARETEDLDAILLALAEAARLELARGNQSEAIGCAEEMLSLATEKESEVQAGDAHLLLGRICLSEGDLHAAEFRARAAMKIFCDSAMRELLWQAHHLLGKVFLKKGELTPARKELKKAEEVVNAISSKLSEELRKTYLRKKEIRELCSDLKTVSSGRRKRGRERGGP